MVQRHGHGAEDLVRSVFEVLHATLVVVGEVLLADEIEESILQSDAADHRLACHVLAPVDGLDADGLAAFDHDPLMRLASRIVTPSFRQAVTMAPLSRWRAADDHAPAAGHEQAGEDEQATGARPFDRRAAELDGDAVEEGADLVGLEQLVDAVADRLESHLSVETEHLHQRRAALLYMSGSPSSGLDRGGGVYRPMAISGSTSFARVFKARQVSASRFE